MEFSKKQDKYFFTNFAVPKASTVYNYKEEDFGEGSIVTDADFEFAQVMTQDDYVCAILSN